MEEGHCFADKGVGLVVFARSFLLLRTTGLVLLFVLWGERNLVWGEGHNALGVVSIINNARLQYSVCLQGIGADESKVVQRLNRYVNMNIVQYYKYKQWVVVVIYARSRYISKGLSTKLSGGEKTFQS